MIAYGLRENIDQVDEELTTRMGRGVKTAGASPLLGAAPSGRGDSGASGENIKPCTHHAGPGHPERTICALQSAQPAPIPTERIGGLSSFLVVTGFCLGFQLL